MAGGIEEAGLMNAAIQAWPVGALVVAGIVLVAVVMLAVRAVAPPPPLARHVRTMVITGAAGGIGRQLVLGALRRGVTHVFALDIDGDGLRRLEAEVAREPGGGGGTCHAIEVDVRDAAAVAAACDRASAAAGADGIDAVICNAGVVIAKDAEAHTDDDLHTAYGVNVLSAHYLLRALLPGMRARRRGAVVMVSSVMGLTGGARLTTYSGTKWALLGLAEALRMELARDGLGSAIPVVAVCPYLVECVPPRLRLRCVPPHAVSGTTHTPTRAHTIMHTPKHTHLQYRHV